jgi:signal peptidase II
VPAKDWLLRLALALQLAGAVGNLLDRITNNGNVTDFISVGRFPVFNVADISISTGVAVLLLGVWLQERRQKTELAQQAQEEALDRQSTLAGHAGRAGQDSSESGDQLPS